VPPEAFDLWLDCAKVEANVAAALIMPAKDALLEAYEVSTAVNRVANDSASLIAPVSAVAATVAPSAASAPTMKAKPTKPKKPKKPDDQASLL